MPNRYTYLILQPILNLAGDITDNVKKGNDINPKYGSAYTQQEASLRHIYFTKARSSTAALIGRMNFFLDRPQVLRHRIGNKEVGVTEPELDELADMLDLEISLLGGVIEKDEKRYTLPPNEAV